MWRVSERPRARRFEKDRRLTGKSQKAREEVDAVAVKRVISWQLAEAMKKKKKTKQPSQRNLPRLSLTACSIHAVSRAARALGKRVIIRIADAKAG
jgi:hypothetical protein